MSRRRNAVRVGIPVLVGTVLTAIALWRVGSPPDAVPDAAQAPAAPVRATPGAVTTIADLAAPGAIGRRARFEGVEVREVVSARTFWFGPAGEPPAFGVLDPDVQRSAEMALMPGARVTLIGMVRPSPSPDQAMRQWQLDEPVARAVNERGSYLHVTEIRER
jgi:hypothetical protein